MLRVGVLSDTHSCFDDKLKRFFDNVDELWHAGDIGSLSTADKIAAFKPLVAVFGNIDDASTRVAYPDKQIFVREQSKVFMTHISGYPGRYDTRVRAILKAEAPDIMVGGHSHILKVMYDKSFNTLFINPGAAGNSGFHQVRTAVRFNLDGDKLSEMEVGEWQR